MIARALAVACLALAAACGRETIEIGAPLVAGDDDAGADASGLGVGDASTCDVVLASPTPTCQPEGAACARASDCCGLDCNGGACGGAECAREGSDCTSSAQCCSGLCGQDAKCALSTTACRPAGEDCTSGGGASCCGVCDDATQRCDVGPGACRLPGAICTQTSECCTGTCAVDASGKRACGGALLPDGAACSASFACAGGACAGDPPRCGAPAAACGAVP